MNRNDRTHAHRLGTYYLIGEGKPIPVRIISTVPGTVDAEGTATVEVRETGIVRAVPRSWVSREPKRFNRASVAQRLRRAIANLLPPHMLGVRGVSR